MPEIDELLKESYNTLDQLKEKLGQLDKVHQDIVDLKDEAIQGQEESAKIPQEFEKKFTEVKALSEEYLTNIGKATQTYFNGNNKVFEKNQKILKDKITEVESLNKKFCDKLELLGNEINRLSEVDLEKGFRQLQDTLASIFNAINAINQTLSSIPPEINRINKTLISFQNDNESQYKELNQLLNGFGEKTVSLLNNQEAQIKSIIEANKSLKTSIKRNRIIMISGFGIFILLFTSIAYLFIMYA